LHHSKRLGRAGDVWHAPVFITLTGGNIGWQIGVQSSDIVLVHQNDTYAEHGVFGIDHVAWGLLLPGLSVDVGTMLNA